MRLLFWMVAIGLASSGTVQAKGLAKFSHFCERLNPKTREWEKVDTSGAAREVGRMFRVVEKDPGWECAAYYFYQAFLRLTSEEQTRVQTKAGEIHFDADNGFLGTSLWASEGISFAKSNVGKDITLSFIAPAEEESARRDFVHGRYVNEDLLELWMLSLAYTTEKEPKIPETADMVKFFRTVEKEREKTQDGLAEEIKDLKKDMAEEKRLIAAARSRSNYGELCNEACLLTEGSPCYGNGTWFRLYKDWDKIGTGQVACEYLFDRKALQDKDLPPECAVAIKKCPANVGKLNVSEFEAQVESKKRDLEISKKDLRQTEKRIEALVESQRGKRTGDARKASDRVKKPVLDSTENAEESGRRPVEGAPAE